MHDDQELQDPAATLASSTLTTHAAISSDRVQKTSLTSINPAPSASTSRDADENVESTYHLKWVPWNSGKIPIVMQSINGPCPLIATMNVLLLREKVKLPPMLEQITATQLLGYLGECIMDSVPDDIRNDEHALLNLEQNIHDAMEILPKLKTGLDVNIRFTGITDFEYTPECIIFDLLRIPLYHGWLCNPDLTELKSAIGNQSYNQLVDNIITNKNSQDPDISARVLIAEEFLDGTASQLTLHGLNELRRQIKENEIGILFRNNHFLTLFKRENEIFTLVTDHGYLTEDNVIWEILDNIEGAGRFFDSNFQSLDVTNRQVSEFQAIDQRQKQLENDYLMALALKEEEKLAAQQMGTWTQEGTQDSDFKLAKRLQEEENRLYDEHQNSLALVTTNTQNPPTMPDYPPLTTTVFDPQIDVIPSDNRDESGQQGEPTDIHAASTTSSPTQTPVPSNDRDEQQEAPREDQGWGSEPVPQPQPPSTAMQQQHQRPPDSTRHALGTQTQQTSTQGNINPSRRPRGERGQKESNCIVN